MGFGAWRTLKLDVRGVAVPTFLWRTSLVVLTISDERGRSRNFRNCADQVGLDATASKRELAFGGWSQFRQSPIFLSRLTFSADSSARNTERVLAVVMMA
jgi:hypothetical protein